MATIAKGLSFYQGMTLTAADIMTAITSATLSDVGPDDMHPLWTGVRLSSPASVRNGDVYYDLTEQRLKIYFDRWYTIAPCSWEMSWRMASAVSVVGIGIGVEVDPSNVGRVRLRTNNSPSFVGASKTVVILNQTGVFTRLGIGKAAVHSAGAAISAKDLIRADASHNGYWEGDASMSTGVMYYGIALDDIAAGSNGLVWYWGPPMLGP